MAWLACCWTGRWGAPDRVGASVWRLLEPRRHCTCARWWPTAAATRTP